MLVKTKNVAEKFLKSKNLAGICEIECKLHESLNFVKGTIYAPFLVNVPDDEIVKELADQNVHSVFKFSRKVDGKLKPSGVILVTFDLYNLPSKLDVSWHTIKVREYIPNPMRCKSCQIIGHTAKFCKNTPTCEICNFPPHTPKPCTRTQCANCSSDHASSSPSCPRYQQQKELIKIKTTRKCSIREARLILKQQSTTTTHPSPNYAQAVSNSNSLPNTISNTQKENTINENIDEHSKEPAKADSQPQPLSITPSSSNSITRFEIRSPSQTSSKQKLQTSPTTCTVNTKTIEDFEHLNHSPNSFSPSSSVHSVRSELSPLSLNYPDFQERLKNSRSLRSEADKLLSEMKSNSNSSDSDTAMDVADSASAPLNSL